MKKRILCVILSLVAVFSLVGFNATEAWFSSGENKSMVLSSGDLNFTASGDLTLAEEEKDLILPGTELDLKEAIVITNTSTIDTELRVRVECTYDGSTEIFKWIEFKNAGESKWEVGEDGFLYYTPKAVVGDDRRIPAPEIEETTTVQETATEAGTENGEAAETTEITETSQTTDGGAVVDNEVTETTTETTAETTTRVYAKNEILLAGTIIISKDVPVDLQGEKMTIKFFLEAKQADFMEWKNFNNPNGMPPTVPTSEETSE
ncbi:MAG: hypothetical protein E7555_02980 [Ruminococcaceae bacterium]|nr:hypothetical protein [Oscillospiraceae bacterium]